VTAYPGERTRAGRIALWVAVVVTVTAVGFPLFWMAVSSLMPYQELFSRKSRLLPTHPTLQHYADLLGRTVFPVYFLNSTVVAVISTAAAVALATLAGYGLTRFQFPGRSLIARAVLVSYMFPPILLSIPLFVLLKQLGLVNSYAGLSLAHVSFALPFAMWLAMIFFEAIPVELDEAAMVDGASRLGALCRVVLPLAVPGVVANAVFVFVLSWNDYLFSVVLVVDEARKTLPVGVAGFADSTSVEWGLMMAGGVLITLPIMIGFAVVQRYLIQGLSAGAIKG
jgi:ABC-type glycerol-3-phosphate transport system permease component